MKGESPIPNKGMTLVEVMVATIIIVGAVATGASYIRKKENKIKKTFRQFIALNRQLDNFARLKQQTYRWVINIDETQNSYWVEKKLSPNQIADLEPSSEEEKTQPPPDFVMDTKFFAKPQKLAHGISFQSVQFNKKDPPIVSGKAYIHYFPEGQFNKTLLKIKGRKAYWSLLIDRLRGELTVINGEKDLKDLD